MRENLIKNNHNIHKNVYPSYLNKSTARLVNPDPKLMFGHKFLPTWYGSFGGLLQC